MDAKGSGTVILPFRPYIYNGELADIKDTVAPPYDVISKEMQNGLYDKSEFNIVRLEFGKEFENDTEKENKYSRADNTFKDWINKGVLKRESENSIYIYIQTFDIGNISYERIGFISLFLLPETHNNTSIYGHETTLSKPKEDRFKLMSAAKANFSPVFSVFEDKNAAVLNILKKSVKDGIAKKIFDFNDENNIKNTLYKVSEEDTIKFIQDKMKEKSVYIADGHHRFETCINFRDYIEEQGLKEINAGSCLMYFAPAGQDGLVILPTHRGIKGKNIDIEEFLKSIKENFDYKEVSLGDLLKENKKAGEDGISFGFAHNSGRGFILSFKNIKGNSDNNPLGTLDVSILQTYILKKSLSISQQEIDNQKYLVYEKDAEKALEKVKNKTLDAVFFMNSTKIEDVIKIASLNLRMPQKSTYFYPKIITGLVINPLIK
ncbi:MAG: DUF1015 domain-containing protein [bacterium]